MPGAHTAARPARFRKARDLRPEHAQFTHASRPGLTGSSQPRFWAEPVPAPLAGPLAGGTAGSTMTLGALVVARFA